STTGGYKLDREFYGLYAAQESADSGSPSTMPVIEKAWTDFSQGLLNTTGNPLDVALSGKGFFTVDGPSRTLYSPDGSFRLSSDGQLITGQGYPVRSVAGTPLSLNGSGSIEIAKDGTVLQDGNVIGKLQVADFTSTVIKQGENYFRPANPSIV